MKRKLLLTLIALLAAITSAQADGTLIDGLYYNLDATTRTAEVTYKDYDSSSNSSYVSGELTIPETVTYNDTTYSVTSIGSYAFFDCNNLTSVTIPNSVTSIGNQAFLYCSSLTAVYISDIASWCAIYFSSVYTNPLYYAKNLYLNGELVTDLIIPESIKTISFAAFYNCSSLTSITIPNSVTSIGRYAFYGCSSLTSVTIPNSVTSINYQVFQYCSSLTSIKVEQGNTRYDSREDCNAIIETANNTLIAGCMNTIIPNSVTSIGEDAFEGCSGLTSVTIPNSVTSIGDEAFYFCSSLTSVTIPNSVTYIDDRAFYNCSSLTSVTIPNSVTSIGYQAFRYVANIVYSGSATGAPWGARSMNGYVDGYLVYSDNTRTTLLACSAAAIGEITIPESVTSIGDYAFYGCSSLSSIYNYAKVPQSIYSNVFVYVNTNTCVLYVPQESVEAYKNAPVWQDFYQIIGVDVPEDKDTAVGDVFDPNNSFATRKVIENGHIYLLTPDGRKLNLQGAEVR